MMHYLWHTFIWVTIHGTILYGAVFIGHYDTTLHGALYATILNETLYMAQYYLYIVHYIYSTIQGTNLNGTSLLWKNLLSDTYCKTPAFIKHYLYGVILFPVRQFWVQYVYGTIRTARTTL